MSNTPEYNAALDRMLNASHRYHELLDDPKHNNQHSSKELSKARIEFLAAFESAWHHAPQAADVDFTKPREPLRPSEEFYELKPGDKSNIVTFDLKISDAKIYEPEYAVICDAPIDHIRGYAEQYPNRFVFVFFTGDVSEVADYSDLGNRPEDDHVVRPFYIGDFPEGKRADIMDMVINATFGGMKAKKIENHEAMPDEWAAVPPDGQYGPFSLQCYVVVKDGKIEQIIPSEWSMRQRLGVDRDDTNECMRDRDLPPLEGYRWADWA